MALVAGCYERFLFVYDYGDLEAGKAGMDR